MDREELIYWAEWVKDLILKFGAEPHTAYKCAGLFVEGIAYGTPDDKPPMGEGI